MDPRPPASFHEQVLDCRTFFECDHAINNVTCMYVPYSTYSRVHVDGVCSCKVRHGPIRRFSIYAWSYYSRVDPLFEI